MTFGKSVYLMITERLCISLAVYTDSMATVAS